MASRAVVDFTTLFNQNFTDILITNSQLRMSTRGTECTFAHRPNIWGISLAYQR